MIAYKPVSNKNHSCNILPKISINHLNNNTNSEKKLKSTFQLPVLSQFNSDMTNSNNIDVDSNLIKSKPREIQKYQSTVRKYYEFFPVYKNNPALKSIYKENDKLAEKIKKIKNVDPNSVNLEDYHNNIIENLFDNVSNENMKKLVRNLNNVRCVNLMDFKTAKKVERIEENNKIVFPGLSLNMLNVKIHTK
jgi:hypothetical protein